MENELTDTLLHSLSLYLYLSLSLSLSILPSPSPATSARLALSLSPSHSLTPHTPKHVCTHTQSGPPTLDDTKKDRKAYSTQSPSSLSLPPSLSMCNDIVALSLPPSLPPSLPHSPAVSKSIQPGKRQASEEAAYFPPSPKQNHTPKSLIQT